MRVTVHQPEFVPWLGFFHKASLADVLILLDDVQFRKHYFQNRNRLRTATGWMWMTVPIEHHGLATMIREVRIARTTNPRWAARIEAAVAQAYQKACYFEPIYGQFVERLRASEDRLISLTVPLLRWMLQAFGLLPEVLLSSSLSVTGVGSQRILELCRAVKASTYVSGISGRDYLDLDAFRLAGIAVEFQEFKHPVYPQLWPGFIPQISALEALFLYGSSSCRLLQVDWPERLETIFV